MSKLTRERGKRVGEAGVVAPEGRRELPEQRAEPACVGKRRNPLEQQRQVDVDLAQSLHVGQVAADLDCEDESRRGLLNPARDHLATGQPVETRVHLDGVEALGVEREPATRRAAHGVEDTVPPAVVVPAGTADPQAVHDISLPSGWASNHGGTLAPGYPST